MPSFLKVVAVPPSLEVVAWGEEIQNDGLDPQIACITEAEFRFAFHVRVLLSTSTMPPLLRGVQRAAF